MFLLGCGSSSLGNSLFFSIWVNLSTFLTAYSLAGPHLREWEDAGAVGEMPDSPRSCHCWVSVERMEEPAKQKCCGNARVMRVHACVCVCRAGGAEDDLLSFRHAGIITHKTSREMFFVRFKK